MRSMILALSCLFVGCGRPIAPSQKECRILVETTSGGLIGEADSLLRSEQYLIHVELPDSIGQNFVVAVTGNSSIELLPSKVRDNYKLTVGSSTKVKVLVFARHNIGKEALCEREHMTKPPR